MDVISISSDSGSDLERPAYIRDSPIECKDNNLLKPVEPNKQGHVRPAGTSNDICPFLDLPAELRVVIYQFLLPHNLTVALRENRNVVENRKWLFTVAPRCHDLSHLFPRNTNRKRFKNRPPRSTADTLETQLFLVNKSTANEARGKSKTERWHRSPLTVAAVLYGSNTYRFIVNAEPHAPRSLRSPLIFGPFGDHDCLHLLRNLRSVNIFVILNCVSHMSVKRLRARLEYFVEVLQEYADDKDRRSLLQALRVDVVLSSKDHPEYRAVPILTQCETFMFGLESLASLCGIKNVEITGLPDWYAKCLQLCIQGQDREVNGINWPLIEVKRRGSKHNARRTSAWVTTRKWYQPMLNWKEYATRNNIPLPGDIEKFWTSS